MGTSDRSYRDLPGINWSRLKSIRVSPLQYRHDCDHPREPSDAMLIGTAIHCLALEGPEAFAARFAVYEGRRDARTKVYQAFLADIGDRDVLKPDEANRAHGAAEAVIRHPIARRYVTAAGLDIEHAIQWTDEETGLRCKARVDIAGTRLVELKSSADVVPRRFASTAARLGYHAQMAFYEDGLRATGRDLPDSPILITVQQDPPYDVVVYDVPNDVVDQGRRVYRKLLRTLAECLETDTWPGIAGEELTYWLPAWADEDVLESEPEPSFTMGGLKVAW